MVKILHWEAFGRLPVQTESDTLRYAFKPLDCLGTMFTKTSRYIILASTLQHVDVGHALSK